MKKNTDKLMTKQNNPLGLILFTIIYIFLQKIISSAFFLFLMAFMISYGNTIEILMIPLIIGIAFVYYFGYLSKDFFQKINKLFISGVMIIILLYFIYKIFNNNEFEAGQTIVYIFCTISYISYTIGAFHSDKVKKILDRIKFKRKKKKKEKKNEKKYRQTYDETE